MARYTRVMPVPMTIVSHRSDNERRFEDADAAKVIEHWVAEKSDIYLYEAASWVVSSLMDGAWDFGQEQPDYIAAEYVTISGIDDDGANSGFWGIEDIASRSMVRCMLELAPDSLRLAADEMGGDLLQLLPQSLRPAYEQQLKQAGLTDIETAAPGVLSRPSAIAESQSLEP